MGNMLICEKCEPPKACNESVINLSDNCMDRLTSDDKKSGKESVPKDSKEEDDEWMKKLKCLDDIHSNNYGLTIQAVDELFKSLEEYFYNLPPPPCSAKTLLFCLKNNANCMIRCKKLLDEFVDCVDTHRINKVKERMELEKIRLKLEEEEANAKKAKDEKANKDEKK